jgi:hypothetical protein
MSQAHQGARISPACVSFRFEWVARDLTSFGSVADAAFQGRSEICRTILDTGDDGSEVAGLRGTALRAWYLVVGSPIL